MCFILEVALDLENRDDALGLHLNFDGVQNGQQVCGLYLNKTQGDDSFNVVFGSYLGGYIQGSKMVFLRSCSVPRTFRLEQLSFKAPSYLFKEQCWLLSGVIDKYYGRSYQITGEFFKQQT